jgi:hypothetical protein
VKGLDEDEGGFGSKLEIGKTGATLGEKVATAAFFYRGEHSLENFALLDPLDGIFHAHIMSERR